MGVFIPKEIPEEHWHLLNPNRVYGIKCDPESVVHLRFGTGGMFMAIHQGEEGECVVNTVSLGDGGLTEVTRFVKGKKVVVGRSSECHIRISHPIFSRKHVEISLESEVLVVTDLGSTNKTYCHSENFLFDIEEYLSKNPPEFNPDSTIDTVHEAFGTTIDEFLKNYAETMKKEK